MAQSDIALSYDQIRQRLGNERGYGTVVTDWSTEDAAVVEFCVEDGSRTFYTCYDWGFLTPLKELTIPSGASEIPLPPDFGFMVDGFIYFEDNIGGLLNIGNDGEVLKKRQVSSASTGRPCISAVVWEVAPGITHGQTAKLIFWPVANTAYTIQVRYSVIPNALSTKNPFPYGGAAHSQTILEGCLAASERLDGVPGYHNQLYAQALEQSKVYDRKTKPQKMGYNGDPTKKRRPYLGRDPVVTYTPSHY